MEVFQKLYTVKETGHEHGLDGTDCDFLRGAALFGSKRIPEVARALGRASREFKNARDSVVDEVKESIAEPEKQDGRTVSERQLPDSGQKEK